VEVEVLELQPQPPVLVVVLVAVVDIIQQVRLEQAHQDRAMLAQRGQ